MMLKNSVIRQLIKLKPIQNYYSGVATIFMLHRVGESNSNKLPANENMKVSPTFLDSFIELLLEQGYEIIDQKYVKVRHKDGIVLIDETLKELEQEFEDRLFRVHRNAIINLSFLDFLETLDAGQYQIRFKGIDETLAVSRRHLPALRDKIQSM